FGRFMYATSCSELGPGITATSSQPSSPQLSRICLVACTSRGTVTYSHLVIGSQGRSGPQAGSPTPSRFTGELASRQPTAAGCRRSDCPGAPARGEYAPRGPGPAVATPLRWCPREDGW